MRTIRNAAFVLLVTVAVFSFSEPAAADECPGYPGNPAGYADGDCYPEYTSAFENAAENWCESVCGGSFWVCRLDIFVWSNPCEASCYCDIPPFR